jgi:hypothetical protein
MILALSYSRMGGEVLVQIAKQIFCDELIACALLLRE